MLNYSTEEHIVGKWIDGSNVYEKTIELIIDGSRDYKYTHNISNRMIISASCVGYDGNVWYVMPNVSIPNTSGWSIVFAVTTNMIEILVGTATTIPIKAYCTIRYLK